MLPNPGLYPTPVKPQTTSSEKQTDKALSPTQVYPEEPLETTKVHVNICFRTEGALTVISIP